MFDKFLCKHIKKRKIRVRDILNRVASELANSALLALGAVAGVCAVFAAFLTAGEVYYILKGHAPYYTLEEIGLLKVAFVGAEILAIPIICLVVVYAVINACNKVLDIEVAHCPIKEDEK